MSERTPFDSVNADDEALFESIGKALARLHKNVPPDEQLNNIRFRFPTPASFFEASPYMLRRSDVSNLDAYYFTMVPAIARRAGREALGSRPKLDGLSKMKAYLNALFIGVHVECFYLVMLTATGLLIDARLLQRGTVDSAPFYLRETLAVAVDREARAIVLCHNHPGGTPEPSKEDLVCTLNVLNAVTALGVPLLDHVIVARGEAISIRQSGHIPGALWEMQAPDNRLNARWLER